jgi:hypothetical protein
MGGALTNHYQMQRGWLDNPALQGGPFDRRSAWAWLIEKANWKPGPYPAGGCTIEVERGQLCHSYRFIATAWGWSVASVQRFINRLQTDTMVDTRTVGGRLVITICNYNRYQAGCRPEKPATDTAADTTPIRDRYRAKKILTNTVEDTGEVGGMGGAAEGGRPAPEPEPEPAPGGKGKGWSPKINHPDQLDLINDTALAAEPAPVAPVQAVPIDTGPPDLGVPALGGNVVPIGTGRKPREAPGRRWGADEAVPIDWIAEAAAMRRNKGLPEIDLDTEAETFADYWRGKPGAEGRKTDWRATWRNWVRKCDKFGGKGHGQGNSSNGVRYSRSGEGSSREVNRRAIIDEMSCRGLVTR